MTRVSVFLWISFFAGLAFAQDPATKPPPVPTAKASISTSSPSAGLITVVDGTKSNGELAWTITPTSPVQIYWSEDRRQAVIVATSPGYAAVTLIARNGSATDVTTSLVRFGDGSAPMPSPQPNPSPQPGPMPVPPMPTPTPPDTRPIIPTSDVGRGSYDATIAVPSPSRKEEINKIITRLRAMQDRFRKGDIDPGKMMQLSGKLKEEQSAMTAALGAEATKAWKLWATWFGDKAYKLYISSKLSTKDQWIKFIDEVICGLEAAR